MGKILHMDIHDLNKAATLLAKEGEFDLAIDHLKNAVLKMKKVGGYGNNGYTKIIPYFQKAGRYKEAIEYSLNELLPALFEDCRRTFSQKPEEIQEAFYELGCHQIFDKLRLNAKREKLLDDEIRFKTLSEQHFLKYQNLLNVGENRDFHNQYCNIRDLFGNDSSSWPQSILTKFGDYHGKM